jgi:hypothetical protein
MDLPRRFRRQVLGANAGDTARLTAAPILNSSCRGLWPHRPWRGQGNKCKLSVYEILTIVRNGSLQMLNPCTNLPGGELAHKMD